MAVAGLSGAENLIGRRHVENGQRRKADRARELDRLKLAVLEGNGLHLGVRGAHGGKSGRCGSGLEEQTTIGVHDESPERFGESFRKKL